MSRQQLLQCLEHDRRADGQRAFVNIEVGIVMLESRCIRLSGASEEEATGNLLKEEGEIFTAHYLQARAQAFLA